MESDIDSSFACLIMGLRTEYILNRYLSCCLLFKYCKLPLPPDVTLALIVEVELMLIDSLISYSRGLAKRNFSPR